jgi:thioredoxin:protein disulfide reductase
MRLAIMLLICLVSTAANAGGMPDPSAHPVTVKQSRFLTPDQAFGFDVVVRDAHTLQASFSEAPGYYLYRDKIRFSVGNDAATIAAVSFPKGKMEHDPNFGDTEVFRHSFQVRIILDRTRTEATRIALHARYQGCTDLGVCYLPIDKTKQLDLPIAEAGEGTPPDLTMASAPSPAAGSLQPHTQNSHIATLFKAGNFWLIVTFFFGAGLLLSFTPCVFPMIPILSGIIVGHGRKITHMHAFVLSLAFVLGMAITYAAAGVAAGFSGDLISNALQTPWVLGSFAGVFVLLSLSMLGFYELQLPASWQSKLSETSNRLHGGHLGSLFVMGALSAVIMGPCVTAPLAGALLYIGQTHDAVTGGIALFVLALGMGAPLLLVGTSAGILLPRAGPWMIVVKRLFGVMLLALSIWIIQPLLPVNVQMFLWSLLLILSAAFFKLAGGAQNAGKWYRFINGTVRTAGALLGIAYLIGALSGARDILHPLGGLGNAEGQNPSTLHFSRISDVAELDQRLKQAHGRLVILDFYADWCISCKEMDRYTFSDPDVESRLNHVLLLKADVTEDTQADKDLLKRYGMYGPPGILFFDAQGKELSQYRVIGYEDPKQFLRSTENSCQVITIC